MVLGLNITFRRGTLASTVDAAGEGVAEADEAELAVLVVGGGGSVAIAADTEGVDAADGATLLVEETPGKLVDNAGGAAGALGSARAVAVTGKVVDATGSMDGN